MVLTDGAATAQTIFSHSDFSGVYFTESTEVFDLYGKILGNILIAIKAIRALLERQEVKISSGRTRVLVSKRSPQLYCVRPLNIKDKNVGSFKGLYS